MADEPAWTGGCGGGGGGGFRLKTAHRGPFQVNVERWGMSEQAQGETKWRLGELARVREHHGHASAVRLRRQQENGARPVRTTRRPSSTSCRRSTARGTRWRFRSAKRTSFFLWLSLFQSTGKKLDLLGQWTLKKRLAGATSEPTPSCPSCACDWEHLDVAALPGSCPAMGYMHFSCSHLCHLSLSLSF